jgi:hypothetical protein
MRTPTTRARLAVAAVVSAGLCLAGAGALASPSQADPGTCDTAYNVADLTAGQAVTGLTVSSGTTPSDFSGQIIGVITDGVEPGVDLVMAKLTSPDIDANGIWEGMSGSPVYDQATGDLIGAVSYTLSYGQTSIAGITPWQDMEKYAGTPAPTLVRVPTSAARAIAGHSAVTAAQAAQGFHELTAPSVVAGVSQRAIDKARTRPYLSKDVAGAGHTSADSSLADMTAGGNLVATMSTGDITIGGLGTITSVCDSRVVGFGHPMNFVGKTTYGMAGASALYVQGDPLGSSFKVANIGTLLGTIDQDRMTGISGPLGTLPPSTPITSTVTYQDGSQTPPTRTGETDVQMRDASAEAAYYELATNTQVVMDAYAPGSEQQSWTITGHRLAGPFTFSSGNVYVDKYSIADGASYDVPDLLWALSKLKNVTIDSVDVQSTVSDDTSKLRLTGVQQRRGGAWVDIDRHHPAVLTAGKTAKLQLVFKGGQTEGFTLAVPAKAAGMGGELDIQAGFPYPFERGGLGTFAGIQKAVDTMTRNDQARVELDVFGKRSLIRVRSTTAPAGKVLSGRSFIPVKVL